MKNLHLTNLKYVLKIFVFLLVTISLFMDHLLLLSCSYFINSIFSSRINYLNILKEIFSFLSASFFLIDYYNLLQVLWSLQFVIVDDRLNLWFFRMMESFCIICRVLLIFFFVSFILTFFLYLCNCFFE